MTDPLNERASSSEPAAAPGWERATLERLAFATLAEQKAQRRWRNFFRLAWLLLIVSVLWLSLSRSHVSPNASTAHTALVEISGEISSEADASADWIVSALRNAFEDEGSQAVVLLINSPGGSPVQAGIINDEIHRLKKKHGKPVYAVVEESCASAAYYIAVAADQIYVDKASIVGSIGVLMDGFGFTGLMDKLGVEPFSPQTKTQRAFAQAMLDQIHQQFIQVVREGRGDRLKETPELFSGLFWTGQQAIQMGLADALGSLDYVAREVVKAEDIVDYTRHDNVAERLAKRFGAAIGEGAVKALRQLEHAWRVFVGRHRLAFPGLHRLAAYLLVRQSQAAAHRQPGLPRQLAQQRLEQRGIAVGCFNEHLGLPGLLHQLTEAAQARAALGAVLRQVTYKRKVLAIQATGRQRQHQRNRADQGYHRHPELMCGPHHRGARVGNRRHACLADQAHVVTRQRGRQQGAGIEFAQVVASLVHFPRQFHNAHLLQRLRQWYQCADALEVGARGLGVLAHPMRQPCRGSQGGLRHHFVQRHFWRAAEIQRRRNQEQGTGGHGSAQ
jgi:protease-4